MQPTRRSYVKLFWLIPIIVVLGFCYFNSLQPVSESRTFTLGLLVYFKQLALHYFNLELPLNNGLFRKIGHFIEFMLLGFFLYLALVNLCPRTKLKALFAWLLAILAASLDEILQLFADNRGAQLKDVLLDSSGALTGIILALLLVKVIKGQQKPR